MLHEDLSAAFPGGPGEHEPIPHVGLGGSATRVSSAIAQGISAHMERATALGFSGLVVGLSGGVDSAVACALAARSSWPVHALVVEMDLPDGLAPDTVRSRQLADRLDVAHTFVNASQLYREHLQLLPDNPVLTRVHLRSRVVTTLILQLADSMSCLAIDTTDRSEIVLRMYEESFRGHVAPLAGLYKSQVYEIGDALGLSDLRVVRSGCPELVDFDAYGLEWDELDGVLTMMVDAGVPIDEIGRRYRLSEPWLAALERRIRLQPLRTTTEPILPRLAPPAPAR